MEPRWLQNIQSSAIQKSSADNLSLQNQEVTNNPKTPPIALNKIHIVCKWCKNTKWVWVHLPKLEKKT